MRYIQLLLLILAAFAVSCSKKEDENPYQMEMNGLMQENKQLNEAIQNAEDKRDKSAEFANLLQGMNEKLEAENKKLRLQVEELSAKNDELKVQLGVMTERERQANEKIRAVEAQKEEATRQQELKRQQSLADITAANQPSPPLFRVFDVMYVGKKQINGYTKEVGRISIRNYSDQQLSFNLNLAYSNSVIIPPNSSKTGIYLLARKGGTATISAGGYSERITW